MAIQRPYIRKWKFFKQVGYSPRKGQELLHKAADHFRYLGYYAYPRAGKSYGAAMEVAATVAEPNHHVWLVAPTYALGSKEFGYIWDAHAKSGWLQRAKHASFNIHSGEMRIEYPWGWWVEVKSAEKPQLLLAEELDEIILCEGARLPETIWFRSLFNRAEKRKGRVFVPTTPAGINWIHTEFWGRAHRLTEEGLPNKAYDREYWALRVSHLPEEAGTPNVCIQDDVYDQDTVNRARAQMPPQLFREQFGGDFVSYAGLVYPRDYNVLIEPFDVPEDWHVVVGYDHGASGRQGGMTAITFWAFSPTKPRKAYLFDMIYASGHGANWYAAKIREKLTLPDGRARVYDAIVVDPSARQVRIELSLVGLVTTTPMTRQFKDRYTKVSEYLTEKRLFVMKKESTKPWMFEVDRYEWKDAARGEVRGDDVRGPDDAMDSTGYAFLHPLPRVAEENLLILPEAMHLPTAIDPYSQRVWENWRKVKAKRAEEREEHDPEFTGVGAARFDLDSDYEEGW